MTVVQPNSISGINSITVQSGQSLSIHDSGGNLLREIVSNTGFSTVSGLSVGSAVTAKDYGVHITGVTTSTGGLYVGTAATIAVNGNAAFAGIVTVGGDLNVQGDIVYDGDGGGMSEETIVEKLDGKFDWGNKSESGGG